MAAMDSSDLRKHISQITTLWTIVCRAHGGQAEEMAAAQKALLDRYGGAIQRYLRKAVPDAEAVKELYQEFALRLVSGRFRNVDRTRGRFRDYLKSALYHLIVDYRKQRAKELLPLPAADEPAVRPLSQTESEKEFLESWRDHLLARSWKQLAAFEKVTGQPVHAVLRLRVDNPKMRSPELAESLAAKVGKPFTADAARQALHRARQKFADLLIDEVVQSLKEPTFQQLEDELIDLKLLEFCGSRLGPGKRTSRMP
jgi:RNA polymerase sigma-70 factor (ECF subfamily)